MPNAIIDQKLLTTDVAIVRLAIERLTAAIRHARSALNSASRDRAQLVSISRSNADDAIKCLELAVSVTGGPPVQHSRYNSTVAG